MNRSRDRRFGVQVVVVLKGADHETESLVLTCWCSSRPRAGASPGRAIRRFHIRVQRHSRHCHGIHRPRRGDDDTGYHRGAAGHQHRGGAFWGCWTRCPAFFGLCIMFLVWQLLALSRIHRPESLKEYSPPELGREFWSPGYLRDGATAHLWQVVLPDRSVTTNTGSPLVLMWATIAPAIGFTERWPGD